MERTRHCSESRPVVWDRLLPTGSIISSLSKPPSHIWNGRFYLDILWLHRSRCKMTDKPRNAANDQPLKPMPSGPLKYHRPICKRTHPEMGQAARSTMLPETSAHTSPLRKTKNRKAALPLRKKRTPTFSFFFFFFHRSLTMAPFSTSCPLNPAWQRQLPWSGHLILSPSLSDGKH